MTDIKLSQGEADMKGWLFKWTNYIKGYQRRWFVLSNGVLSYYRNQAEITQTCRGTINLHGALIHTEDSCTFVISNGGAQTFHIKATSEIERQRWVTALELAKANAIRAIESEEDSNHESNEDDVKNEVAAVMKALNMKIEDLRNCNDLIIKHGAALHRSLSELESIDSVADISAKIKALNERATLFRITSNAMIKSSAEYLKLTQSQGRKWQRMLQHERQQRIQLEEMVEQLAREQTAFERVSKKTLPNSITQDGVSSEEDENAEFYDAQCEDICDQQSNYNVTTTTSRRHSSLSNAQAFDKLVSEELAADDGGSSSDVDDTVESAAILTAAIRSSATIKSKNSRSENKIKNEEDSESSKESSNRSEELPMLSENAKQVLEEVRRHNRKPNAKRRDRIPDKPNHHLHIWSILKNCIGKDLSKIPMPVNFSEPLSMLQRLTEDFEYASILDTAAELTDQYEKLAYVAAFTISMYSTTVNRTSKPFNPLLGETFECDRTEDLGWRAVNEQVSHHPPVAAQCCEGKNWISWQELSMASKFRGKYLQVVPTGTSHLKFKHRDDYYTWSKVTTTVHNIIVGKLWVDQEGETEVINHTTGSRCHLVYVPYSYFGRDQQRKVKGRVVDKDGEVKYLVNGTWDNKVEIALVIKTDDNGTVQTGPYKEVWQRVFPREDSDKYYNFTELACQLNEMEEGIAPTDSRLRPDQRLMELGMWDDANIEKLRLEEKQRQKRRERVHNEDSSFTSEGGDTTGDDYKPLWFKKKVDLETGNVTYVYGDEYWQCKQKRDWSRCSDIF